MGALPAGLPADAAVDLAATLKLAEPAELRQWLREKRAELEAPPPALDPRVTDYLEFLRSADPEIVHVVEDLVASNRHIRGAAAKKKRA